VKDQAENSGTPINYFVDEAGDGTLFNAKGKLIIGTSGCSRFFILGLLEASDPVGLSQRLEALRARLLVDPYFENVPSMQPQAKKTALAFHAKDDLPEVRREVFSLLAQEDLRFFAAVKSKKAVHTYVESRNRIHSDYRYHPNELYDYLVRNLFVDRLHQHTAYRIVFAARGASDRTKALEQALDQARKQFSSKWGTQSAAAIDVSSEQSSKNRGLQAVDYFLWALQRLYERNEDRFIRMMRPQCSLVRDIDDDRTTRYGKYYNKKTPLNAASLEGHPEI
jgi:Protein of unknown function (DUF3800)